MDKTDTIRPTLVYFGSTYLSAGVLKTIQPFFQIKLVVTRPDKPSGRKKELEETPVSKAAREFGIPVIKPESLKKEHPESEQLFGQLKNILPDIFLVFAYGQIIPQRFLDIPKHGAVNIHPSLLPKYRGPSPIRNALLNGDTETGVSIMLMDSKMDHGPLLAVHKLPINPRETLEELENKISAAVQEHIVGYLQNFLAGKLRPVEQDEGSATYTAILTKEDGKIDWNKTARDIFNAYRAYGSWPGIWTIFNNKILKITRCDIGNLQTNCAPGEVYEGDEKIVVCCGKNSSLELLAVQPEGKTSMDIKEFINGHKNFVGSKLGT